MRRGGGRVQNRLGAPEREVAHERICFALPPERGHLPMAGNEMHVVSQRPEFLGDGRDQLGVIAAREVRASDRAPEHDIAYEGDFRLLLEEDDVARCVAWAMPNARRDLADLDLVAIRQPAVRGACFALKSVSATVLRQ